MLRLITGARRSSREAGTLLTPMMFNMSSDKPSVGIIGLTGHAQRLRDIIEPIANVTHLYHPNKKIDDSRCTQEFKDMIGCDAIIIASPNDTHLSYLTKLRQMLYNGYIFCEKPPVSHDEIDELCALFDDDSTHIYFNFQYAHAKSFTMLDELISSNSLGDIISISFKAGHGLALEDEWTTSWRSDGTRHALGVVETLGIHFIERAMMIWTSLGHDTAHATMLPLKMAPTGTAYDTADINIVHSNASIITPRIRRTNILVSYATPFMFEMNVVGTNGIFSIRDNELIVRCGRRTFDDRGYFIQAPIVESCTYDAEIEYERALQLSVMKFISYVSDGACIPRGLYDAAVGSMKLLHELYTTCVALNTTQ